MTLSRDAVLGVFAMLLAGGYFAEATGIQQSLLADAVGADGVPRIIACAMGLVGLSLAVRGAMRPAAGGEGDDLPMRAHMRALLLLGMLVAYTAAVPVFGYTVSVAALIAAVAAFAGARPGAVLAVTAVAGAGLFWVMFRLLLGIPMPGGTLTWG